MRVKDVPPRVEDVPVSVALASFNGEPFIREFLHSLLSDLRDCDEIIVVDDASSDSTADVIAAFNDPRIRLIGRRRNEGVLATFDEALRLSSHEYVFLADQDDIWVPGKRDYFLASFLSDPRTTVVISDAELTDACGSHTRQFFMESRGGFHAGLRQTLWRNRYLGCCMALKRDVLRVALPIPRFVPMHDMWLGLIARCMGRVQFIPLAFLRYRRHAANLSPISARSLPQRLIWRGNLLLAFFLRIPRLCYWLMRRRQ